MRHLDLFSGIAGFSRAAEGYGFTTTLFCEIDPACQQVIAHHYPGVPIVSDTSKYRMCGNSIAIPCARFVMAGIAERLDK